MIGLGRPAARADVASLGSKESGSTTSARISSDDTAASPKSSC